MPKLLKNFFIFILIFTWIFSGRPQIWNNPRIPPDINKALAAEVAIGSAVSTGGTSHVHFGSQTVFISGQTGYKFYRDSSGECAYSKTTNGGGSWGEMPGAVV